MSREKFFVNVVTENRGKCFLILGPAENEPPKTEMEVLIYNPTSRSFATVESVFPAPKRLRVGIGNPWGRERADGPWVPNEKLFYAELEGASALAAHKTVLSRYPMSGLRGCVDSQLKRASDRSNCVASPTGKLPWDPTPGRTWKLSHASFDLRRGMANEVDDINSGQLDEQFSTFVCGSLSCSFDPQIPRGSVATWHSDIVKVFEQGKWKRVDYDPRFLVAPPPIVALTHTVRFKDPAHYGEACLRSLTNLGIGSDFQVQVLGPDGSPPFAVDLVVREPIAVNVARIEKLPCVEAVFDIRGQ